MNIVSLATIKTMTDSELSIAAEAEVIVSSMDSARVETIHTLHGGIYSRTIVLKSDEILVGAKLEVPTTLVISGNMRIYIGGDVKTIIGTAVITASKHRKQVMVAIEDTSVTMTFATTANTIRDAEEEFTKDSGALLSRLDDAVNIINISGE